MQLVRHLTADLLPADIHKGSQMGKADALAAVLAGSHLGNDLRGNIAGGGEAVGLLNQGTADDGAVLQHILQVHQIAVMHVLSKIVRVMEMDDALLMGLNDIRRKQNPAGDILADFAGHIVALDAVDRRVLVGILR